MTDFAWFPVTGDGLTSGTAYTWQVGTIPFNTKADWVDVDNSPPFPILTGFVPGTVSGGVPQDNVYLFAGQGSGSTINQFYHPNPALGDPFIATGPDGNYDFSTDVLLNSGSVQINTLGLEQVNALAGPFAPTLDIEGATLDVAGSVISTFNANLLPAGLSGLVQEGQALGAFLGITLPQPGGTIDIGSGGQLEVGGSIDAQVALKFNGGTGNVLRLDSGTMPAATIFGFAAGDTIDLAALAPATASGAAIGAGNTLTVDESSGATLSLNLDPAQNFAGLTPTLSSDGKGGTDISFGAPAPTPSNTINLTGNDTFNGGSANNTITSSGGHNLIAPGSGNDIIFDLGSNDVIFPDTGGSETIFAFGPVLAAVGAGKMAFVNGANPSTVLGGGSGSAIINAGAGGGLYAGGTGGENVIIGGSGACTMFGSSGSDLLAAGGSAANLLIAGGGNETLTGVGSTGANVMYAGGGNDLLGGGAGTETFFAGHGHATVIGGTGADLYGFVNGLAGGTEAIFGFDTAKGDLLSLQGYGANEVQTDLANQVVAGGNTTLTLSDHTQVTFVGVTGLTTSAFA